MHQRTQDLGQTKALLSLDGHRGMAAQGTAALGHQEHLAREKELRLQQIAEALPQLILGSSPAGECDFCSAQWVAYTGRAAAEQHGSRWLECVHPSDREALADAWRMALREQIGFRTEYRVRRHDGTYHWFDARVVPLRNGAGELKKWFTSHTDVDEPRAAKEQLRAARTQLATALEAGRMGAWVRKVPSGELWMDDVLLQVFGRTRAQVDAEPEGLLAFVHQEDRARIEQEVARLCQGGLGASLEFRATRADGEQVWLSSRCRTEFDDHGHVVSIAGVTMDITREKLQHEEKLRCQKLEALGTLASGVAHDVNNVLQAVLGHAQLALLALPPDHPSQASLEQIMQAATRGGDLARRILTFSRPEPGARELVRLPTMIFEAVELLRATLPSSIAISMRAQEDVPLVRASATELHQIIVNLVTNAAHALEGRGGFIRVAADAQVVSEEQRPSENQGVPPGSYALLTISDNGTGMSEAVQARIFDPFFTTKPVGRGTGLGLSVVHSIVSALGGHVRVTSQLDVGTVFRIYLPVAAEPAVPSLAPAASQRESKGGRVLYVDDDPVLVQLGAKMLECLGYEVTSCDSSSDALTRFAAAPDAFDLVCSDLTMPSLSGFELTRRLLKIRPNLPVIVMSGLVGPEQRATSASVGAREILLKPVALDDLARAVARHSPSTPRAALAG